MFPDELQKELLSMEVVDEDAEKTSEKLLQELLAEAETTREDDVDDWFAELRKMEVEIATST